jgi:type IV secretion system protein VirD4
MNNLHSLYQLPGNKNNSYGISWLAIITGFLLIILTSGLATQYLAFTFNQNEALTGAIFSIFSYKIYQPFAWVIWNWQLRDMTGLVAHSFMIAHIIVGIGSFASIIVSLILFYLKNKKEATNYDLHGSARFATKEEIMATGLLR